MAAHGRSAPAGAADAPGRLPRPRSTPGVGLDALAELLGVPAPTGPGGQVVGTAVTGVTIDSRDVRPGDLFAAVPGANVHRADFVPAAAAAGAVAVLTDARGERRARTSGLPVLVVPDPRARLGAVSALVYGEPARALETFGVTGTNGKTTTTYLLEAGLTRAGLVPGLVGTIGVRLGPREWASARTTPEASDLQALLAAMVEHGARSLAMEVSSHALVLGRVDGLRFDVAIYTNLGRDHLDFHGSMEEYFRAKSLLFTEARCRAAVVNIDDAYGQRLAATANVAVTTYSALGDLDADWRVADVERTAAGSTFTIIGPGGVTVPATVALPGSFNIANGLAAVVALVTAGISPIVAADGVASCTGVPGRMETVSVGQPFAVVVDYAHTPDSVESALATLRPVTPGRLVLVLGCGGDRDRAKRPIMGRIGAAGADLLIVTDDNPRTEDPGSIRAALLEGAREIEAEGQAGAVVCEVADRRVAIETAVRGAQAGDTVLVAGRGHEPYQEIAGELLPFDDRAVVRVALGALSGEVAP